MSHLDKGLGGIRAGYFMEDSNAAGVVVEVLGCVVYWQKSAL